MFTFIRYIEVYFTFAFLDCVYYNEDFVKSRPVLLHTFYCNFGRAEENLSLYGGRRYKEDR